MKTEDLVGLSKDAAIAKLKKAKLSYRMRREDRNYFVGTADLKPGRFNLSVDNGIVTEVRMG